MMSLLIGLSLARTQAPCSCAQKLFPDPDNQCFNVSSDLRYSRYTCPVQTPGSVTKMYCGSVFCLNNVFGCGGQQSFDERRIACEAIGGFTDPAGFQCRSGVGSDRSEENCQFTPPLVNTTSSESDVPTTTSITDSPTSGSVRTESFFILAICVVLFSL